MCGWADIVNQYVSTSGIGGDCSPISETIPDEGWNSPLQNTFDCFC